jgi:histidine triad (HIT) family protein
MNSTNSQSECLFCKFASGAIPVEFVRRTESYFAINDINPQAPTHVLIIPMHHQSNAALSAKHDPTFSQLFTAAAEIALERGLDGYRTVFNTGESAGQSVFHAHLHLLGGRSFAWPPG